MAEWLFGKGGEAHAVRRIGKMLVSSASSGLDFRSQQAVIFIGAIGCNRPKAGDALEVLDSKAEDILWEIAEFERV